MLTGMHCDSTGLHYTV